MIVQCGQHSGLIDECVLAIRSPTHCAEDQRAACKGIKIVEMAYDAQGDHLAKRSIVNLGWQVSLYRVLLPKRQAGDQGVLRHTSGING